MTFLKKYGLFILGIIFGAIIIYFIMDRGSKTNDIYKNAIAHIDSIEKKVDSLKGIQKQLDIKVDSLKQVQIVTNQKIEANEKQLQLNQDKAKISKVKFHQQIEAVDSFSVEQLTLFLNKYK